MPDWNTPQTGGCRCGAVRIRLDAPPLLASACHCTGCQRMTASAFSLTLTVPSDGFAVTQGDTVIGGIHGTDAHHHHCDRCKSWMFTRVTGMDWFVNLRPSMLDDRHGFAPFIETWTSEMLPWAMTGAVHSYPKQPEMERYQALVDEYATWRAGLD